MSSDKCQDTVDWLQPPAHCIWALHWILCTLRPLILCETVGMQTARKVLSADKSTPFSYARN